jgi:hypothetical protein
MSLDRPRSAPLTFNPEEGGTYMLSCPHCGGGVTVQAEQLNCRIFRHAVLISTGEPVGAHESKEACERLVAAGLVYGCGRPFRVVEEYPADAAGGGGGGGSVALFAEVCGYI